ncbi:hypothetical protein DB30_02681 [Enhygromyxa salina]|uniref:Uncharacterized protein n=1 Tax=Enhygromyxa salina TaxID=215803 RepID=A0A0C2DD88_9BACT|nr:DUF2271 domain-containing protein [Enhygromyxa salina]KIG19400.1 hypothetical protein DB30_02681 [Enhygromyxa salina]
MAATDRNFKRLALALALSNATACMDEGGLHVAQPDPPNPPDEAAGDWGSDGDEAPADEGLPPGLDEDGGLDDGSLDDGGESDGGESDGGESQDALAVFIQPGATWRYTSGDQAALNWTAADYDDSAWATGPAPLGDGFEDVATSLPPGPSQLRSSFDLTDPSAVAGLLLRLRRDDGAIVWLNGGEVFRTNMPATGSDSGLTAQSKAMGIDPHQYYWAFPDPALLLAGTNVLAVSLHPHSSDDDLILDAMLRGIDPEVPPEALSFRVRTRGYDGKYGPKHVGAIWLEDANGFVRTLEVWGDTRREHLVAWRAASDDNDVDAITGSTRKLHGTHQVTWDLDRLDGTPASPGPYAIHVEYTEANSNKNAAAGPQISVQFELGAGPSVATSATNGDADNFTELLLYAP